MTAFRKFAVSVCVLCCAQLALGDERSSPLDAGVSAASDDPAGPPFDAYDYAYCLACHGSVGQGNPALQAPVLAGMERWYLRNQLQAFRQDWRGAHAADLVGMEMRAVAMTLQPEELDAVTDYIAALEAASPVVSQGDAGAGASRYAACAACHGERAEGNEALEAPALWYQQEDYLLRQMRHFRDAVRGSAPGDTRGAVMQAASRGLTDAEIATLVAYIRSLHPQR